MGFLEAITIILIVLKLLGIISISWLGVFTPLLLALAFYVIMWILVSMGVVKSFLWFKGR